jgi:site-specific DNA-methyltransferase (adenine-specific)
MENKKKKYGEVLTPQFLVNHMLDTLPEAVWSNPDLKWLDPCAGRNGIFPITVYDRLMDGLAEWEPDAYIRSNHIMNNMLYMVELQEDAVEELKQKINEHIQR